VVVLRAVRKLRTQRVGAGIAPVVLAVVVFVVLSVAAPQSAVAAGVDLTRLAPADDPARVR
jgi:hypothetical protein